MKLADRVAIVTGAAQGIGAAIARLFAENGARVVVADVNEVGGSALVKDIAAAGGYASFKRADVSRVDDCRGVVTHAVDQFGRLDILVNNAAVSDATKIDDIELATWKYGTGIILDGAFICTKACLAALRASGAGAVINIGGMSGHTGAAGRPHVTAAKMGLVGLTRGLAHDLAPDNITVNCVVPGLIDTVRGPSAGGKSPHLHEGLLGRRGKPEEVADVICFLAGPRGRYITGQDWHVNGGAYLG